MSKSKSTLKLKQTTSAIHMTVQEQQQLPAYILNQSPVFLNKSKSQSQTYFMQHQDMLKQDTIKCTNLLKNYITAQNQSQIKIKQLQQFTCNSQVSFDSGLPFYSCKNIIFNQYLICLKFYQLFRLNAADFTTGPGLRLYQRLVYLKTLILKLAPVQKKLQYQKNKLLKKGQKLKIKQFNQRTTTKPQDNQQVSNSEQQQQQQSKQVQQQEVEAEEDEQQNNLVYKPMVKSLINKSASKEPLKQGKYIAPRQSSVLPAQQKAKRRQQRQQQRRKAHLLRKFRGDIQSGDQAQEKDMLEGIDPRFKRRYEQKLRYEEENFTRLNETKKEKYWKKQAMKNRFNNTLNNEIKQIQMIRQLVDDETGKSKRPTPIGGNKHIKGQKGKKMRKTQ